jgi:hypothetical protein
VNYVFIRFYFLFYFKGEKGARGQKKKIGGSFNKTVKVLKTYIRFKEEEEVLETNFVRRSERQ